MKAGFATEVTVAKSKTEMIGGTARERLRDLAANRYWGAAEGRAAVAAFEASRLSKEAFARATGIKAQRLVWWRRRAPAPEPAGKIEFVPVEVARPALGPAPARDAEMEIAIGDVRIRVWPGFDADALRRLLSVVAEPAC